MKCARFLELVALCLSDGGIGFSSSTMYIHFTSSSHVLLDYFKKEIRKFSNAKIHVQHKPRGITLRVYDRNLVQQLLAISPSYRTRPCNHFPLCPIFKNKERVPKYGIHKHLRYNELIFAEVVIPEELFQTVEDKARFMRIYASCDGYPSIFPRQHSWSVVERMAAVVCHQPFLKQRLHEILVDLEIPHRKKPHSLAMRSRDAITKFKEKIGFLAGVEMTGNSRYWKGYQKNAVLDIILKSYDTRFKSKDPSDIISILKKK